LYDNLWWNIELVEAINTTILTTKKDWWKEVWDKHPKKRELRSALTKTLNWFYNVEIWEVEKNTSFVKEDNTIYVNLDKLFNIIQNQQEY
jgi:hypothetical protein